MASLPAHGQGGWESKMARRLEGRPEAGCVLPELFILINPGSVHCSPARGSADWPQTSAKGIGGVRIETYQDVGHCHSMSSVVFSAWQGGTTYCPPLCWPWGHGWADPSPVAKFTPCSTYLLPTCLYLQAQGPCQAPRGSSGSLREADTYQGLFVPGESRMLEGQTDALSFAELLDCEAEAKTRVSVLIS